MNLAEGPTWQTGTGKTEMQDRSCPSSVSLEVPSKVRPVVKTVGPVYWVASVPAPSTLPEGAVNMTNALGTVVLFLMENGYRKAAPTAGVDTEFCTASLMSSMTTVMAQRKSTGFIRLVSESFRQRSSCVWHCF